MAVSGKLSAEAVQKLVESHRQFLAFLERRVESRAVAEDILQSAFVRGLERGSEVRDEESVVAWFYRVLRNAVVDHYRHRDSAQRMQEKVAQEFAVAIQPDSDIHREICGCVMQLMETLKPEYREALEIIDIGEGSLKDLATHTGTTPANAAVRIHRARQALRKRVANVCATCAEHGCVNCRCKSESCS